jgi:hypothetical protein
MTRAVFAIAALGLLLSAMPANAGSIHRPIFEDLDPRCSTGDCHAVIPLWAFETEGDFRVFGRRAWEDEDDDRDEHKSDHFWRGKGRSSWGPQSPGGFIGSSPAAVANPEPGTWLLMLTGAVAVAAVRRRLNRT